MRKNINNVGLVSIIIPVYNSQSYIKKCLESVHAQNYNNIEIVIIDDGSTDGSKTICDEYAQSDKRIKVIHQRNSGPSSARNTGIKSSRGEFIFFLDSDDFIEKDAIKLLVKSFNQHKAEIIIGDFKKIQNDILQNRNDIFLRNDKLLNKKDLINYARLYLKKPNKHLLFAFSWGRLFKASIIKENNIFFYERLHTFEDVAFNFDYLKYTNKVSFVKKTIYNHNVYDNYSSATMALGSNPKKFFGYKQALTNIDSFLKNNINNADVKKEIGHAYISLTIIQLIRVCGQINDKNKQLVFKLIQSIVNDLDTRNNLKFYSPLRGDSKAFAILIKLKIVRLIILLGKYKAYKRYKKNSS